LQADVTFLYWFPCLEGLQLLVCPDVGVDGLGIHLAGADALAG